MDGVQQELTSMSTGPSVSPVSAADWLSLWPLAAPAQPASFHAQPVPEPRVTPPLQPTSSCCASLRRLPVPSGRHYGARYHLVLSASPIDYTNKKELILFVPFLRCSKVAEKELILWERRIRNCRDFEEISNKGPEQRHLTLFTMAIPISEEGQAVPQHNDSDCGYPWKERQSSSGTSKNMPQF